MKEITVAFYTCDFPRRDWRHEFDHTELQEFVSALAQEYAPYGIRLSSRREETVITVNGYGDLLNAVRLRSVQDGIANLCLGHVIGASANRDLFEDVRRGVSRIAFAPEMIEPEGDNKRVCHNCGCGC